ncbi:DUF1918 domain-containing protein [Streptomyces sp. WC2508]|uniref:DUF1918 domain-containing protein n=1 Tax=unclassified Streptomyces TaxID=2593676 RepID=UPI0038681511
MRANAGDEVVMHAQSVGEANQTGKIAEVLGADGAPPYLVRFDDGNTKVVSPGPDTAIASTADESA